MIVGNGMIAKSLCTIDSDDVVFFASGVSNSMCKDIAEYDREIKLLKDSIDLNRTFVYFSSIEEYILNDQYLQHKRDVQSIIKERTDNFIIIKVPQLIGQSGNSNNFINYIYNSIWNNEVFNVILTKRSLLDVDDLVKILSYLLDQNFKGLFSINYIKLESVIGYIEIIENLLGKKAKIGTITTVHQNISKNSTFVTSVIDKNVANLEHYNLKVIQKYKIK